MAAADKSTTLLLIRHGQTEWNAAGRVQGQTNSDLTTLGRRQARAVARWLAPSPHGPPLAAWKSHPSVLYASDLTRTQQTAAPIADRLGLEAKLDPDLREMDFGELEGMDWQEVERTHPEAGMKLWGERADPSFRMPGGESRDDMHIRSKTALRRIAAAHPGETVAIVSHGGVIGFFFRAVVGIPFTMQPGYSTPNGSVNVFRFDGEGFKLLTWGLVPALAPEDDHD